MKETYIMNCKLCKICIADFMLCQFERTVFMKKYAEIKQERKKESKIEKLISTILH